MNTQSSSAQNKPLIGLNLDFFPGGNTATAPLLQGDAKYPTPPLYPQHAINYNYVQAIEAAGGTPILIPHVDAIQTYVAMVDGFVFSGGMIDLAPEMYGETANTPTLYKQEQRTQFDIALMQAALKSQKPILGICAGCQLLNVVSGGSLYQHIPDSFPNSEIEHFNYHNRHVYTHDVILTKGSLLHHILEAQHLPVNSSHHMAVKEVAPTFKITAQSPDGVPEGIESTEHPFRIGVQWHPEFFRQAMHQNLFNALIHASQNQLELKQNAS